MLKLAIVCGLFFSLFKCPVPCSGLDQLNSREENKGLSDGGQIADVQPCTTADHQLLANFYVDYFRSAGPCKTEEDSTLVHTYAKQRSKMASYQIKTKEEELCQTFQALCKMEKQRNGRFIFGFGNRLLYRLNSKIRKFLKGFPDGEVYEHYHTPVYPYYTSHYSPPPYQPTRFPFLNSIFSALNRPQGSHFPGSTFPHTPTVPSPPAPPPVDGYLISQPGSPTRFGYPGYHGEYPSPTQYSTKFEEENRFAQSPFGFKGETCVFDGNSCIRRPVPPGATQKNSKVKRSNYCGVVSDVVFPMVGKSLLDNSSVLIIQDIRRIIQPVFFKICRTKYPDHVQGRCIQEYLPINLFTSSSSHRPETNFPQEFIMVESGCRLEES